MSRSTKCGICGHEMQLKKLDRGERRWTCVCPHCHIHTRCGYTAEEAVESLASFNFARMSQEEKIICPYYVIHSRKQRWIRCSGKQELPAEDGIKGQKTLFRSHQAITIHMQRFCKSEWQDCKICKAMEIIAGDEE